MFSSQPADAMADPGSSKSAPPARPGAGRRMPGQSAQRAEAATAHAHHQAAQPGRAGRHSLPQQCKRAEVDTWREQRAPPPSAYAAASTRPDPYAHGRPAVEQAQRMRYHTSAAR
eukprot:TRINITY_DN4476_c2_g1_i1.p4 TRINITY_DN4476_c2_g1~~TRINITY_DN4476_c2_g1_i1.p4  ORF type:complete len:115 (+),score=34.75 TRINITY_DN4476_c2_g1_i1:94-438(+)